MRTYPSVKDSAFRSTVADWLDQQAELLVMFQYPYVGGSKDYELHSSAESIFERVANVPAQTAVTVFRQPQLQLRGVVTPDFIEMALSSIPDGVEFLLVETTLTTAGSASWHRDGGGTQHSELREELEWSLGKAVMLGEYPPWFEVSPDIIYGYVPDQNGIIEPGAY